MKRLLCILILLSNWSLAVFSQTHLVFQKQLKCHDFICNLEIQRDTNNNFYLCLFDNSTFGKQYLIDISGCGNCDINNDFIHSYIFNSKNDCTQYVVEIGDISSTYGATNLFFIWYDNQWNIIKSPFQRYVIKDIDNNGIFEIIDYTTSAVGISYCFDDGNFILYKK